MGIEKILYFRITSLCRTVTLVAECSICTSQPFKILIFFSCLELIYVGIYLIVFQGLFLCLWRLFNNSTSGIYVEIEFLDGFFNYGQVGSAKICWDTWIHCCNYPKIWILWFYHWIICQKMQMEWETVQTQLLVDLGPELLVDLGPWPVCSKTCDHYNSVWNYLAECAQLHADEFIFFFIDIVKAYHFQIYIVTVISYGPRQANLCLRAFHHDKF